MRRRAVLVVTTSRILPYFAAKSQGRRPFALNEVTCTRRRQILEPLARTAMIVAETVSRTECSPCAKSAEIESMLRLTLAAVADHSLRAAIGRRLRARRGRVVRRHGRLGRRSAVHGSHGLALSARARLGRASVGRHGARSSSLRPASTAFGCERAIGSHPGKRRRAGPVSAAWSTASRCDHLRHRRRAVALAGRRHRRGRRHRDDRAPRS